MNEIDILLSQPVKELQLNLSEVTFYILGRIQEKKRGVNLVRKLKVSRIL